MYKSQIENFMYFKECSFKRKPLTSGNHILFAIVVICTVTVINIYLTELHLKENEITSLLFHIHKIIFLINFIF